VRVAGQRELRLQRRFVEALLGREVKGVAGDEARRREPDQSLRGDFDELQVAVDRLTAPILSAEAEALGRLPGSEIIQALRGLPAG